MHSSHIKHVLRQSTVITSTPVIKYEDYVTIMSFPRLHDLIFRPKKRGSLMPPVAVSLLFALLAAALSSAGAPLLSDPDTAWHIAAGDLIREHGTVHLTDPWSFTAHGYPWLNIFVALDLRGVLAGA